MVGGAPVTQNFADEIGADGYARMQLRQLIWPRPLLHRLFIKML